MKLNGFTVQMRASARCPSGHEFGLDAHFLIEPCEKKDIPKWKDQAELYLHACWHELERSTCDRCRQLANTKWSPS